MCASHRRPRGAFTLIELLVVIGILLTIAVMGYLVLPKNMAGDYNRVRGIDQMMEWLLTAKQRAKRDLAPTGIRLVDPATNQYPTATNLPTGVMFVQQPDLLAGTSTGGTCKANTTASTAIVFTGVDFVGGASSAGVADQALVQQGDYLQVNGGAVHQVSSVSVGGGNTTVNLVSALTVGSSDTQSYVFYRQPRPISGEDVKQLPADLVIDMTGTANASSLNVPSRKVVNGLITTTFYEIVFSQSGAVVGYGTSGGKIVLWMRDNATASSPGPPTLISIQSRTGFIGAFDVNPTGTNAYSFTEDGRSSGL